MNLDYDDGRITCPNCGKKEYPEVGMSLCDCHSMGEGNNLKIEYNDGIRWRDSNMGWFSPEPECSADVGVMGHLSCSNSNCSCKSIDSTFSQSPSIDIYGNVEEPSFKARRVPPSNDIGDYVLKEYKLKYKSIIHKTEKAKLFAVKHNKELFEVWVPNSCILGLSEKKVIVSNSFYHKSVVRQIREQGGII
jgi:hypothetical protein